MRCYLIMVEVKLHTVFSMFVYPSDTVLIRLGIMSVEAMMSLRDDTTCIVKSAVGDINSFSGQRTVDYVQQQVIAE